MITVILETAARSLGLALAALVAVRVFSPGNVRIHKLVWTSVVLASLAMPLIALLVRTAPAVAATMPGIHVLRATSTLGVITKLGSMLTALYTCVTALLLLRLSYGVLKVAAIRRAAVRVILPGAPGACIVTSAKIRSPATFGSTILLPRGFEHWSPAQQAAVLAHECAHVLQRDWYILWLAQLNAAIFWFNPCAWWMLHRLRVLAETTSDDAACEVIGDRPGYAQLLLEIAQGPQATVAAIGMTDSNLPARIERLISGQPPSGALRLGQKIAVVALSLPFIGAAAMPVALAADDANALQSTTQQARVIEWPADQEKYYPAEAAAAGTEGSVTLAVTLDQRGRATDTLILSEEPLGVGFGAAASTLAHSMSYANPTGRTAQLKVRIKFALGED